MCKGGSKGALGVGKTIFYELCTARGLRRALSGNGYRRPGSCKKKKK